MIEVYRWRQLDRWDSFTIPHLHIAPHLPQKTIGELLTPRHERVDRSQWSFDQLQPITIHFGGDISRRRVAAGTDYTMPLFWAKPGDVVLSKIDLKNGAVGVLPEGWDNAVVTSHFKVYAPDVVQLDPRYFRMLLQTHDFKKWLWANRSGADGRTEVKLDVFEALAIPLPPLTLQQSLCNDYVDALNRAAELEQEAEAIERAGWQAFEAALGVAPPLLPDRPVFVARFKDVERWNHESILRTIENTSVPSQPTLGIVRLGDVIGDLKVGWSPKCLERIASADEWGVLKLNAVTTGKFDESANKALPPKLVAQPELEVRPGDVLITRGSGVTRLVGATVFVESARPRLIICDLMFRVAFFEDSPIVPRFLAEVLKTSALRKQIEERRTGDAPMMQKITKTALIELSIPLPDKGIQQQLVDNLLSIRNTAGDKRRAATALRQSAWSCFESALFTTSEEPAIPATDVGMAAAQTA